MSDNERRFSDFQSALQRALSHIGRRNGHASPTSDSNLDPMMHHLLVDTIAARFFEKQKKEALAALLEVVDTDDVGKIVKHVLKHDQMSEGVVLNGGVYNLMLTVKRPAQRVDTKRLVSLLKRDGRIPTHEIDELVMKATQSSAAPKSFTVVPR